MSIATDLADAVLQEINAKENWPIPFTASRIAVPRKEIKELNEISISVIPSSVQYQREARDYMRFTITIDIGIQKHLDGNETDAVCELGTLVDEIAKYMTGRKLTKIPSAKNIGTSNDPLYIQEHILQKRVFTSVISLKYQKIEREDLL
ncbi:MAG: hypothetical protein PHQ75_09060 [Thermoguttaceae bacterium]|nr:hypothetical protein [Thermoguttaceae bacterium]